MFDISRVKIRRSEHRDFEHFIEIAGSLPEWFTPNGIEHMVIDLRFQQGFAAIHDSRILGFLSYFVNESIAHIGWIGVLPVYQRKGIGRKLVDNLISELGHFNVRKLRVNTLGDSVDYEPYERTRAFYRGIGFRDFQRIAQDNPECPEKLILEMEI